MSTSNLEPVTVNVTPELSKAIRILSRSSKLSASDMANNLFTQIVRGRLKAKAESAAEDAAAKWQNAADIMGADKMPVPKVDYVRKYVEEYRLLLSDLQ